MYGSDGASVEKGEFVSGNKFAVTLCWQPQLQVAEGQLVMQITVVVGEYLVLGVISIVERDGDGLVTAHSCCGRRWSL